MNLNLIKQALAALVTLLVLTGNAQAVSITVSGNLSSASPTFNRTSDRAGFPDSVNNALPYDVIEIKTGSLGGTVTATVSGSTQFDSFLALYSSFSPTNPSSLLLAADDDSGTYPNALLTANGLAPNRNYWLVVSSYSASANAAYPLYGNYDVTISGDLVFYAITATASPLAGGSVSCTPNPVAGGSSSTCTATANPGYTFSSFSGACNGATCVLNNVTSAKSVTANFVSATYAITATASPVAGGTVGCTPNPVSHGSSSSCTASAYTGYTFSAFSGDCSGATCSLSNVTATKSVTATFTAKTAQTINLGPAPSIKVGQTGIVTATASSGLLVSFSITPSNGVCSLAGAVVTGISQGICTVYANQSGNATYAPAPQGTIAFSILPANITTPTPPTITSITAGPGKATINFTPPSDTGGAPIASYTASCAATGETTRTATGTGSPITVSGLKSGVSYSCSLTASNGTYSSSASAATTVTVTKGADITPILMLLLD